MSWCLPALLSPGMAMIVPHLKAPFTLYSQPRHSQQRGEHTHQSLAFSYLCFLRVCGKFPFFHTLAPKKELMSSFFLPWTWQTAVWMQRIGERQEGEKAQVLLSLAEVQSCHSRSHILLKAPASNTVTAVGMQPSYKALRFLSYQFTILKLQKLWTLQFLPLSKKCPFYNSRSQTLWVRRSLGTVHFS